MPSTNRRIQGNANLNFHPFRSERRVRVIYRNNVKANLPLLEEKQAPARADSFPYKENQFTLGDLHGNALKLLYFLVRQRVLEISENDYAELARIYKRDLRWLTRASLDRFLELLYKAKVNPVGLVRLIGDEVADRGKCDYFTLKIIEFLLNKNVPLEIILSNHGMEFIEAYEIKDAFTSTFIMPDCIGSMSAGLQGLIDRGLVKRDEVLDLANAHYKFCLKALSYTLSADKQHLTIYSHAAVGIKTIACLAKKLKVEYRDGTALELAATINRINEQFSEFVKSNRVHCLFGGPEIVYRARIENRPIDQEKYPFDFITWNRLYKHLDRPSQYRGYSVSFVHGHDLDEPTRANIYNLDNMLGKSASHFKDHYHILYTQDRPAPRKNQAAYLQKEAARQLSIKKLVRRVDLIAEVLGFLALGLVAAAIFVGSGGLAALPFLAVLGAGAVPVLGLALSAAFAAIWRSVIKPLTMFMNPELRQAKRFKLEASPELLLLGNRYPLSLPPPKLKSRAAISPPPVSRFLRATTGEPSVKAFSVISASTRDKKSNSHFPFLPEGQFLPKLKL